MGFWPWTWGKKKEGEEEKTAEGRVAEAAFPTIESGLLTLRDRLNSGERNFMALKAELERIRIKEYPHLNREQRKELSGLFKEVEKGINSLKRKAA